MYGCGCIDFEEAYHLYSSFSQFFCPDKQAFRDKLLDEIHGFPVYVITQPIMRGSILPVRHPFPRAYPRENLARLAQGSGISSSGLARGYGAGQIEIATRARTYGVTQ